MVNLWGGFWDLLYAPYISLTAQGGLLGLLIFWVLYLINSGGAPLHDICRPHLTPTPVSNRARVV
ncbi:MAG: hypothetical protein EA414_19050 [Arthrospira sp. PLM2.Bin9]|nr:MAG: hypothetical protein EA414_19050 [Arthrospira sp. PLM2.Bin9]